MTSSNSKMSERNIQDYKKSKWPLHSPLRHWRYSPAKKIHHDDHISDLFKHKKDHEQQSRNKPRWKLITPYD